MGDLLNNLANIVKGFFQPQPQKIVSPMGVKSGDLMNDPALAPYYNSDSSQDTSTQPSNFQPKTIQYPSWMGSAPSIPQAYAAQTSHAVGNQTAMNALTQRIQKGLSNYGAPAATQAAAFAQAGYGLPDPLMPAVLSLKETSGGKNLAPNSANNWLNLGPNINYPSPAVMLNGGGTWGPGGNPQQGFSGIIHSGAYNDYLKSGNLMDFFKKYTPTYDRNGNQVNGTPQEQVNQYKKLEAYFPSQ